MSDDAATPSDLDYDDSDLTPEEWGRFISYCWRDDWNDPREDIYTLGDGTPSHPTGPEREQ